jgi:hypothetical protein
LEDIFNSLNLEPEYEDVSTITLPGTGTRTINTVKRELISEDGNVTTEKITSTPEVIEQVSVAGAGQTVLGKKIKNINAKPDLGGKTYSSAGGSSSKASKTPSKKDGIFERYKEINEAIEDNQRLLERTNKAADRLYGVGRLKKM